MAQANGMVFNNGFNPMTGFIESGTSRPLGSQRSSSLVSHELGDEFHGRTAWADPASSNFYLAQQGLPMRLGLLHTPANGAMAKARRSTTTAATALTIAISPCRCHWASSTPMPLHQSR